MNTHENPAVHSSTYHRTVHIPGVHALLPGISHELAWEMGYKRTQAMPIHPGPKTPAAGVVGKPSFVPLPPAPLLAGQEGTPSRNPGTGIGGWVGMSGMGQPDVPGKYKGTGVPPQRVKQKPTDARYGDGGITSVPPPLPVDVAPWIRAGGTVRGMGGRAGLGNVRDVREVREVRYGELVGEVVPERPAGILTENPNPLARRHQQLPPPKTSGPGPAGIPGLDPAMDGVFSVAPKYPVEVTVERRIVAPLQDHARRYGGQSRQGEDIVGWNIPPTVAASLENLKLSDPDGQFSVATDSLARRPKMLHPSYVEQQLVAPEFHALRPIPIPAHLPIYHHNLPESPRQPQPPPQRYDPYPPPFVLMPLLKPHQPTQPYPTNLEQQPSDLDNMEDLVRAQLESESELPRHGDRLYFGPDVETTPDAVPIPPVVIQSRVTIDPASWTQSATNVHALTQVRALALASQRKRGAIPIEASAFPPPPPPSGARSSPPTQPIAAAPPQLLPPPRNTYPRSIASTSIPSVPGKRPVELVNRVPIRTSYQKDFGTFGGFVMTAKTTGRGSDKTPRGVVVWGGARACRAAPVVLAHSEKPGFGLGSG
ncbi:hypothetical protein BDK51DRAFT_43281 [Blyttiomyces helicus]|uniref:Uncharacterized protein n=1 Tax=Blyttiomyces helicus TaxID=388810 RepID=A0A4P9WPL3_9FUNG|nr:hypothetical protein BDK51DRAFT_43281 [Blyttiomyces helicus]|eukprot:RKO94073.1 hypothetical protein BDK51DRAFT_43281 [Blyttiomyces helicus]